MLLVPVFSVPMWMTQRCSLLGKPDPYETLIGIRSRDFYPRLLELRRECGLECDRYTYRA